MKAGIVFTGTGPILILTTYTSFTDTAFVAKLGEKGIDKFIAHEIPLDLVRQRYGGHYAAIVNDVKQTDDLRILDFNGYRAFHNFSFAQMGDPIRYETAG
jgi:hypothetical protein